MEMVRKELKGMKDLLIEKAKKNMTGKVKEMKKRGGTIKRNDNGSIPQSRDRS